MGQKKAKIVNTAISGNYTNSKDQNHFFENKFFTPLPRSFGNQQLHASKNWLKKGNKKWKMREEKC